MRFALSIFIRLNIFAFCVLLNLHEAEGLPPIMSRFLDRFVYRRSKGKRHVAQRHKPAVFHDSYPADTELVFRVANNYNVPSVDYSQIDFGQTYHIPPVENTYLARPPAPISLHHYNSVPARYNYNSVPARYNYNTVPAPNNYNSVPARYNYNQPPPAITTTSPPPLTAEVISPSLTSPPPPPPAMKQQTPSQIISSLREPTELRPPLPPSSINSILNLDPFSLSLSSINDSINGDFNLLPTIEIGKEPPPKYKVADNFQQSFQVTLTSPPGRNKKKRSFQDNSYSATNNNNYEFTDLNTSGYTAPITSYTSPNTVYAAPNTGYTAPNTGYAAPNTGYAAPTNGYGAPNTGYSHNSNGVPSKAFGSKVSPVRTKQGSIVTRNKIYFTPKLLARRSQPLQVGRRLPPVKPTINLWTPTDRSVGLHSNISSIIERTKDDGPKFDDKTYVAVRLQSYSTLRPPGNDTDLMEAQTDYGFGSHNFLFSSPDSILSVFEMLLRTDFENKGQQSSTPGFSSGNSLEDTIDCIRNFVNATERIHFWSHSRGESDAGNLFQIFPRDPIEDAIPFIDTAPVTDTLAATVF